MIPRRGFIFNDDDCRTAQLIVNPLRGNVCFAKCFYGYIFPTGNGWVDVSVDIYFPVGKRNLGAFLRRRYITIERECRI